MTFNYLYDKKMIPNWNKLLKINEFSILKKKKIGKTNVFDMTREVCERMLDELDNVILCDKSSLRYKILMTTCLLHKIGYAFKDNNIVNVRNFIRKTFFDEDVRVRETVCYLIATLNIPLKNNISIENLIKLSYCNANLEDTLLFLKVYYNAQMNNPTTKGIFDILEDAKYHSESCLKCYNEPYTFDNRIQRQQCFYPNFKYDGYYAETKFKVYVMIGIPGSGKSTWIKNNLPKDIKILSRDTIRTEIGIPGDKPIGSDEQEKEVTRIFNRRMIEYSKKNIDFVIDNTNVKRKYRNAYHEMILEYNPKFIYVYVESPNVDENKERRHGQMKDSVIDSMLMNLEFPSPFEYDELIVYKQK